MKKLKGSCICGSVKYEIHGDLRDVIACHCDQCRKSSGHFTAATATKPENLKLLSDKNLIWYRSTPTAQMGFCSHCGSTLFWKPDSGDRISIYVGTIDGQTGLRLTTHIYTEEKGDYYNIEDGVEQFATTGAKLTVDWTISTLDQALPPGYQRKNDRQRLNLAITWCSRKLVRK